jgi:hypothetical protein
LPPLSNGLSFALGRTVPIKFQLTDAFGNYITSLSAVTSLQALNAQGTNVFTNAGATALRYDSTANQFIANWQTKGLAAGTYTVTLALADGTTQTKVIQLTKNGSGANAQATDGSDVTLGGGAGQLLGGDLQVYVDNSNGDLTSDELARIQDAVTAVDALTAPYGVTVEETTDVTQAAVTLNMDTTSALGGYTNGILGCFDPTAGQITMIQGWNWYAGSDATQIGSSQYDFQTTVTHELGHALGLGESTNAASAMYGTLATGTTIRTLTTADLNIPDMETAADAQRAAIIPPQAAVIASNPPIRSATGQDVFFAMRTAPSITDHLLAKASLRAPAQETEFADSIPEFGLQPIFGGAGLAAMNDDPFADATWFQDLLRQDSEEAPGQSAPTTGRPDTGFEFIQADGTLLIEG